MTLDPIGQIFGPVRFIGMTGHYDSDPSIPNHKTPVPSRNRGHKICVGTPGPPGSRRIQYHQGLTGGRPCAGWERVHTASLRHRHRVGGRPSTTSQEKDPDRLAWSRSARCRVSTDHLSTHWSRGGLWAGVAPGPGYLILGSVSRLDAVSASPLRT